MKFAYDKMTRVMEINSSEVIGLVIENEQFLYQLLEELKKSMDGDNSGIVISKEERPITVSKITSFVTDFIGFTLNQKSLITKIVNELEKISQNELFYQESQKVMAYIEKYMTELTLCCPCEIFCEKLNMQNLLKGVGISIVDDYDTLEERLLAYMDLSREFEGKELFIFVNLRCLIPNEKMQLMIETALMREHKILLIDNVEYPKLYKEKRIIIDKDLCEI